jgi:hypothetical protein
MTNFYRHYNSNRAPLGLYFHSNWFKTKQNRCEVIQKFTSVIFKFSYKARAFVAGKPFQLSLSFDGKYETYKGEATFRQSTLGVGSGPYPLTLD